MAPLAPPAVACWFGQGCNPAAARQNQPHRGETAISPGTTSLFILGTALGLLFFWLRLTCAAILRSRAAQDRWRDAAEEDRLQLLALRRALGERAARPADPEAQLPELERDYAALTFLLRSTAASRLFPYSHTQGLLMLDFQIARFGLRLRRWLRWQDGRGGRLRMGAILDYFSSVLLERLEAAWALLGPTVALTAGPGLAIVQVCSYCLHVQRPTGAAAEHWLPAEQYRRQAAPGPVVLSHGICPGCYENFVRPSLPPKPAGPR